MIRIESIGKLEQSLLQVRKQNLTVGFVPTMGALHQGHLDLIRVAQENTDFVICSIFVNPLQFNNKVDFDTYPIQIEEDISMLESRQCNAVFMPKVKEMFPKEETLSFNYGQLGEVMEGKYRPGHFNGMLTVIKRFFELIHPDVAVFGEKDYQQLALVKWMVKKLQLNVKVIPCPTVREVDGLAMSSRNLNLNRDVRQRASLLHQALDYCRENKNTISPSNLVNECTKMLESDFKLDYFRIVDENTFANIEEWSQSPSPRAFVAAFLSGVRLIDNLSLID